MKSGQCDDPVDGVIDHRVLAQDVTGLTDAEDDAGLGIDPQLRHEVNELAPKILMI
jgi:hypothetical protein